MKTEREQYLDDILTTAVEGGIGYWSVGRKYVWSDDGPASVEIKQDDEDDDTWHLVDRSAIRKGIAMVLSGEAKVHESYAQTLRRAERELDAGEIDGELADIIVQAAILGEVVYG
jgi:hypothetical protein